MLRNIRLGTYTNFTNLLDLCAAAVPAGCKPGGMPFGVTWLAPAGRELELIELVRAGPDRAALSASALPTRLVKLAVAGAHLSGQPLNHQLVSRGAQLVSATRTATEYRLYALDTQPPKPGLVRNVERGYSIAVENWELTLAEFGDFVRNVPAPMTIGMTKLIDGSWVKGFSCEPYALQNAEDISHFGGWREYLTQSKRRDGTETACLK